MLHQIHEFLCRLSGRHFLTAIPEDDVGYLCRASDLVDLEHRQHTLSRAPR